MKWHLNKPAVVLLKWLLRSALLLVLSAVTSSACAQQQLPVRMRLEPISIRGRSGGPILLQIKLEYNETHITEGDLLLRIYNSVRSEHDLLATIRHEGIVLQGSDYIFNTVLPPIEHSANKQYLVSGWFETETERIPLTSDPKRIDPPEPHQLLSIGAHERAALIGSYSGRTEYQTPSSTRDYLNHAISLINYAPDANAAATAGNRMRQTMSERVHSFTVDLDALKFPEDPLRLCTFDVILLADGALGRLQQTQLSALTIWIQAGGSVCILPDSNRLTGIHLQFLQTLFEDESANELQLALTEENTLQIIGSVATPVIHRRFGLGNVSLLPNVDDLPGRLKSDALAQLVSHLWKVRSDSKVREGKPWAYADVFKQLSNIEATVDQDNDLYTVSSTQSNSELPFCTFGHFHQQRRSLEELKQELGRPIQLQPTQNLLLTACNSLLVPDDIEIVPTSVIALLLLGYIITIGPIDYLLLGFFKARKYTWILFPFTTAVFTVLTLAIAHQYMSTNHTGATLSITDIVDDGHPARRTDVELHFSGANKSVSRKHAAAFTVAAQSRSTNNYMYTMRFDASQTMSPAYQSLTYSGRFPQQYNATQEIRQWEPRVTRTTSLSPDNKDIPELPWNDAEIATTPEGRNKLRALLEQEQQKGKSVDAIVINGRQTHLIFPEGGFLFEPHISNWWIYASRTARQMNFHPQLTGNALAATGILAASAELSDTNFFSIVSQVSPSGSASFEDLPIVDITDPGQTLLIIVQKKQDNYHVYRRLYHSKGSAPAYSILPEAQRQ